MTIAAAHLGLFRSAEGSAREPREFAALARASQWLNSPPLTAASLLGKVVLVDFWTYTCINWLRTLPYIRAWTLKYGQRVVVIGVHTPEFEFERNIDNVRRSVRQMELEFPIAIDNDYAIWRAFHNQYWPALYVIDTKGEVRQHYFGEGEYDRAEIAIQRLLPEGGAAVDRQGTVAISASGIEAPADWENLRSAESYVGYARAQNFASPRGADLNRRREYAAPSRLSLNQWALAGEWTVGNQATVSSSPNARILYRFHARDLHLVMGPTPQGTPVRFRVSIDGQPPGPAHGLDVEASGHGTVIEPRLYQLIRQPKPVVDRLFEIEFIDPGAEAFSFTFG